MVGTGTHIILPSTAHQSIYSYSPFVKTNSKLKSNRVPPRSYKERSKRHRHPEEPQLAATPVSNANSKKKSQAQLMPQVALGQVNKETDSHANKTEKSCSVDT